MTDPVLDPAVTPPTTPPRQRVWLQRLAAVVAAGVTFGLLPAYWHRALSVWLVLGRLSTTRTVWVLGLLAIVVTSLALARPRPLRWRSFTGLACLAIPIWIAVNTIVWRDLSSSMSQELLLVGSYIAASFWLVWVWGMFYAPLNWTRRLVVLVVLATATPLFSLGMTSQGFDGDGRLLLRSRFGSHRQDEGEPYAAPSDASAAAPDAEGVDRQGPDYDQFRGPGRLATLTDLHLEADWQANPPRELWRRPIGAGWGAFAIAGSRAITQEQRGEQETIVCYELHTGRELWSHANAAHFPSDEDGGSPMGGEGPRATPTIDEQFVYAQGATGILDCLDRETGKPIWSVDILDDNGATLPMHGVAGSPLIVDDLVIVHAGGPDGRSLVAYDKLRGNVVWHGGDDPNAYGSPQLIEIDGTRQVLIHNAIGVSAHDPADGRVLWSHPWTNDQAVNCSQPVPLGGDNRQLLISSGYGKGAALIELSRSGDRWSVEELWTTRHLKPKFTSPVVRDGFAYGLDDGILTCIDLADGQRCWKRGRYGHGQVLLVDDLLLVQTETGEVTLVAADSDEHRQLATLPALRAKTWNNPALADRYLLVRNDREAACYLLPVQSPAEGDPSP